MSGEIICSGCDTVVEVTANSVELPFVCQECRTVEEYRAQQLPQKHVVYSNAAPTNATEPLDDGDPGDEHDGATVENTTLLIADLEKQNADLKTQLQEANGRHADDLVGSSRSIGELVDNGVDLMKQNAKLREQYDKDSELIIASNALVQALEAELTAVYKEDIEVFTETSAAIDGLEKERSGLQGEVDKLGLDVISLRKRVNYYQERNNDLFHEVMFYRHQGLFGRLRGRRYEA